MKEGQIWETEGSDFYCKVKLIRVGFNRVFVEFLESRGIGIPEVGTLLHFDVRYFVQTYNRISDFKENIKKNYEI